MKFDFPLKSLLYRLHRAGFELSAVSQGDGKTVNLRGSRKERIERAHSIILGFTHSTIFLQKDGQVAWVELLFDGSPHSMVWNYSANKNLEGPIATHRAQWEKFYA
jgi:hypothetical protein